MPRIRRLPDLGLPGLWSSLVRILFVGAVMALGATASAKETVQQRIDALLPGADLLLPEGEGPFPVVIQMHGCGGKKLLQGRWAKVAQEAGWAVLVVDSYAHRNISRMQAYSTVCTGMQLWGRERAGDLYAAMEWVRHQPWADASHIAAAGWSHGGWTVLDAMAMQPGEEMARETRLEGLPQDPLKGLVGAFLLYPYTGVGCIAPGRGLRVDVPVKALVGTNDIVVGGRGVGRSLERMKTVSKPVDVTVLQGATHAFDEPEAKDIRVRYSPELTAEANGMYQDFLRGLVAKKVAAASSPAG